MTIKSKAKLEGYKHRCPICGKEFWGYADWVYRIHIPYVKTRIYLCSYKCKREAETDEGIQTIQRSMAAAEGNTETSAGGGGQAGVDSEDGRAEISVSGET